ncbi:TPA: hypothetical protein ACJMKJ_005178 [Bacillus wiedmannii]
MPYLLSHGIGGNKNVGASSYVELVKKITVIGGSDIKYAFPLDSDRLICLCANRKGYILTISTGVSVEAYGDLKDFTTLTNYIYNAIDFGDFIALDYVSPHVLHIFDKTTLKKVKVIDHLSVFSNPCSRAITITEGKEVLLLSSNGFIVLDLPSLNVKSMVKAPRSVYMGDSGEPFIYNDNLFARGDNKDLNEFDYRKGILLKTNQMNMTEYPSYFGKISKDYCYTRAVNTTDEKYKIYIFDLKTMQQVYIHTHPYSGVSVDNPPILSNYEGNLLVTDIGNTGYTEYQVLNPKGNIRHIRIMKQRGIASNAYWGIQAISNRLGVKLIGSSIEIYSIVKE